MDLEGDTDPGKFRRSIGTALRGKFRRLVAMQRYPVSLMGGWLGVNAPQPQALPARLPQQRVAVSRHARDRPRLGCSTFKTFKVLKVLKVFESFESSESFESFESF